MGFVVARRPADFNKHKNFQIVVFFPSLHLLASRGRSAAIKYRSTKKKKKRKLQFEFFSSLFTSYFGSGYVQRKTRKALFYFRSYDYGKKSKRKRKGDF